MDLKAKQSGFVGEIAYSHNFETGRLNSGYKISNNSISNTPENLLRYSLYKVNYLEQYLYSEYSGKLNKLTYRLGIGITNIHNKSEKTTINEWIINPRLVLGYALAKNQSLRFTSGYMPLSPSSDALSSNIILIVPNIIRRGNPYLKPEKSFDNSLIYSFNTKYFDLNTNVFYEYTKEVIKELFVADDIINGYALTHINAKNLQNYGVQMSGSLRPLGNDLLTLKLLVSPTSTLKKTLDESTLKHNYIRNYFSITSNYKNFIAQYMVNIPYYSLDGAFLRTNENMNHFFLKYKLNNWMLGTGPSKYKTKSSKSSLVNYTSYSKIYNNNSMLALGISYDFSTGKKTNINKKLNNSIAPAATF